MARIELRHATIRLVDGYSETALINQPSDAPANGDASLVIDTLTTGIIIPIGMRFAIANIDERYYVTAQNANDVQLITVDATSGNYTLGFTGTVAAPIAVQTTANIAEAATAGAVQSALEALAAIAVGDVTVSGSAGGPYTIEFKGTYLGFDMEDLVATDVDLAGGGDTVVQSQLFEGGTTHEITFTPTLATADGIPANNDGITFNGNTVEVKVGDGNLTYNETREMNYELDRGNLDTVREGDQQPLEVNLDFIWDFITAIAGAPTPTIEDAFKQRGPASDWVSSSADACEPYAIDIEIEYVPPCGDVEREIIVLPDFRWESLDHNITDAQVSTTGKCNSTEALVSRLA